ncbi:unnamed protein product [Ixodes pacificus]
MGHFSFPLDQYLGVLSISAVTIDIKENMREVTDRYCSGATVIRCLCKAEEMRSCEIWHLFARALQGRSFLALMQALMSDGHCLHWPTTMHPDSRTLLQWEQQFVERRPLQKKDVPSVFTVCTSINGAHLLSWE